MQLIILDRDGVINQDSPDYIRTAEQWQPIPGSIEAIARLSKAGYTPVVATNQSGLARGLFDLDDLEAMHAKLTRLVEAEGGTLGGVFYCPHHPDDQCKCRKPKTGILDAIEAEFNASVEAAPFIGDTLKDLEAGQSKGCALFLVRTGSGRDTENNLDPSMAANVRVFDDLDAVVSAIVSTDGATGEAPSSSD